MMASRILLGLHKGVKVDTLYTTNRCNFNVYFDSIGDTQGTRIEDSNIIMLDTLMTSDFS